jgi:hypothetical protein
VHTLSALISEALRGASSFAAEAETDRRQHPQDRRRHYHIPSRRNPQVNDSPFIVLPSIYEAGRLHDAVSLMHHMTRTKQSIDGRQRAPFAAARDEVR